MTEARRRPSVRIWSHSVQGPWTAALSHLETWVLQFLQAPGLAFNCHPVSFRQTDRGCLAEFHLNLRVFQTDNR